MAVPANIDERLAGLGLVTLGTVTSAHRLRVLVGNTGRDFWAAFSQSPEYGDGRPNPLDRWTRRVGEALASELNATVVFPFDGPPYPPFLQWAAESGEAFASPIGMNIHRRLGLWHAYRFCLELAPGLEQASPSTGSSASPSADSPCLDCESRPCLSSCPVTAFDGCNYKVTACVSSLAGADAGECMENGCAARRACPVSPGERYPSVQAAFHMRAFLAGQSLATEAPDEGLFDEMPGD